MKKYIVILLLVFSRSALAESYLYIGEASAGVTREYGATMEDKRKISAKFYNASARKWIFTIKDNTQEVKAFGSEEPYYGPCGYDGVFSGYKCVMDYSDQMFFIFRTDGTYIATTIGLADSYTVEMGCFSKI